jgi:hypothetical protein
VSLVLGAIALVEFVRLAFSLNALGFQLGQARFSHLGSGIAHLFGQARTRSFITFSCFAMVVLIQRSINQLRRNERNRYVAACERWEMLYYCERDGWLGVAS